MNFYAYDTHGRILMSGQCPDSMYHLQSFPGCKIDKGSPRIGLDYRDEDGSIKPLPPRPSEHHEFDYATKQWVPNVEAAWESVRNKRNQLLVQSDWTQLPDVPIGTKEVWAVYRQALRDVTEQADPFNIVWPTPPM